MTKKGFTLIELLVVVSIISLLASVVLASLNSARAKGRDAKRLQDITQIRTALELYYNDFGQYPSSGSTWRANCAGWGGWPTTGATGYIPNLAPTYIPVLPVDPKPVGTSQCYLYNSNAVDYMILVWGTVEGTIPASLKRPAGPTELDYAMYSSGAANW